jgi:hypothetical protein
MQAKRARIKKGRYLINVSQADTRIVHTAKPRLSARIAHHFHFGNTRTSNTEQRCTIRLPHDDTISVAFINEEQIGSCKPGGHSIPCFSISWDTNYLNILEVSRTRRHSGFVSPYQDFR